jgi:DNA-binding response OmpR family regulator
MSTLPAQPAKAHGPPGPDPARPGVALCEPDGQLFALFAEWLQRAGFEPLGCASQACAARVALVVADVRMPPQHGAASIAALRGRFPHARMLAISSQFTPRTQGATAAAATLGADAVLAKPFSCKEFMDQVRALT